jgi:hypothetical protein
MLLDEDDLDLWLLGHVIGYNKRYCMEESFIYWMGDNIGESNLVAFSLISLISCSY